MTVRREYDGGSEVESLWMRDGGLVYFSDEKASYDGEEYEDLYGYYRGCNIYPDPEGETSVGHWVSAEEILFGNEADTLITNFLPAELSGEIRVLSEDAETVTVLLPETLVYEDGSEVPCENTVTVNKGTLDIYAFSWEYPTEDAVHSGSFTVEYDGEILWKDCMEDWNDTRAVTVEILTEAGERVENLEVPAAWGLFLYQDEGIVLSSPDAAAGMGLDDTDTMYIAPGGKTVSVFAFDEANYPTDIVTEPEDLDELPFSMDELRENNRITNLLNKYGTLVMDSQTEYGAYSTSYFRHRDVIVRYSYMEITDSP